MRTLVRALYDAQPRRSIGRTWLSGVLGAALLAFATQAGCAALLSVEEIHIDDATGDAAGVVEYEAGTAAPPACSPTSPQEVCDGVRDDNCDGTVDEGCPCTNDQTRPCGSSEGRCRPGTQRCKDGAWATCEGSTGPFPRDCTSPEDNDCDSKVDSTECACTVGGRESCATGMPGVCASGERTCAASPDKSSAAFGACVRTMAPGPLACDGLDHDCDGKPDTLQDAPVAAADVGNACVHLYVCPAADRREICFRTGIGYTYYCDDPGRRILGYAPKYSATGTPNPAPPVGYRRIAVSSTGTKVGPYDAASACCPGGCSNPSDAYDGVFRSIGEITTQLWTRVP